ncbi:MAG: hypothetical protein ACMZI0_18730 [Symbiopectobacterium sp.]|uniref:hypothetical protein n=1 Tax=Symbiopectobacterium sp. TaxID=2952789 RepID=UPI0039EB1BE4
MEVAYGVNTIPQHMKRAATIGIKDDTLSNHAEETRELPKGKLQQLLTGISNSSRSFSNAVKNTFISVGEVFKRIATKLGDGASNPSRVYTKNTSAGDAIALHNAALLTLVSDSRANTVTPKSILSPLLNDGKSGSKDEQLIFDYLIKNPTSHLFSSDNIRCQGDSIYFKKPISLVRQGDAILFITNPMEGRAISRVKIDMRNGSNGEFRGETAMKVLRDETLAFNNLEDLCQKMTVNPQRNISAMMTSHILKDLFNADKTQAKSLLAGEHAERFKAFVSLAPSGHYVSKYPITDLARPTQWHSAGAGSENIYSRANAMPDKASHGVSGNNLSATRRTISPGPRHVREMAKRFDVQKSITDDTTVLHDVQARKQDVSPAIKALQEKLAANANQGKPLRGGIRQR